MLQELALWHVSMYQLDDSASRVDHITSANSLITTALKNAQTAPELDGQARIDLLRVSALVNLYASRHEGDQWVTALDAPYSASADPEFMSLSRMATLSKTGFKKDVSPTSKLSSWPSRTGMAPPTEKSPPMWKPGTGTCYLTGATRQ